MFLAQHQQANGNRGGILTITEEKNHSVLVQLIPKQGNFIWKFAFSPTSMTFSSYTQVS